MLEGDASEAPKSMEAGSVRRPTMTIGAGAQECASALQTAHVALHRRGVGPFRLATHFLSLIGKYEMWGGGSEHVHRCWYSGMQVEIVEISSGIGEEKERSGEYSKAGCATWL